MAMVFMFVRLYWLLSHDARFDLCLISSNAVDMPEVCRKAENSGGGVGVFTKPNRLVPPSGCDLRAPLLIVCSCIAWMPIKMTNIDLYARQPNINIINR